MRKVVSLMHMSLDGYVEGPNSEMDWIKTEEPVFAFVDRLSRKLAPHSTARKPSL